MSSPLVPTAGRVVFNGEDITGLSAPVRCRRGISRTFQITSIFPELSVRENVRIAVQLKAGRNFRLFGGRAVLEPTERRAQERLAAPGLGDRGDVPAAPLPPRDQP